MLCAPNQSHSVIKPKTVRWAGHVSRKGNRRGAYRVLVGRPEARKPFGKPGLRWDNNIKMYLQEVGWRGVNWIALAEDGDRWRAVVTAVMNIQVQ